MFNSSNLATNGIYDRKWGEREKKVLKRWASCGTSMGITITK